MFANLTFPLLAEKNKGKASQIGSCHVLDVCLALSQARKAARYALNSLSPCCQSPPARSAVDCNDVVGRS